MPAVTEAHIDGRIKPSVSWRATTVCSFAGSAPCASLPVEQAAASSSATAACRVTASGKVASESRACSRADAAPGAKVSKVSDTGRSLGRTRAAASGTVCLWTTGRWTICDHNHGVPMGWPHQRHINPRVRVSRWFCRPMLANAVEWAVD